MIEYIKLIDSNVDGCGTDIDIYLQVEGESNLTNGVIERTKKILLKQRSELVYEDWDTDTMIDIVREYLKIEGYNSKVINYNYSIEV